MGLTKASFEFPRQVEFSIFEPDSPSDKRPILFLHGMGESGAGLLEKHEGFLKASGRRWILPNGTHPWERRRIGRMGYSWYFFLGDQAILRASMADACAYLRSLLASLVESHELSLPVSLLGFSQGGYLGSVFAAEDASLVAAHGCLGGRIKHEFFAKRSSYPPMLQLHGQEDFSVSADLAREGVEAAKALGVDAAMQIFADVGHEITEAMLQAYLDWESTI